MIDPRFKRTISEEIRDLLKLNLGDLYRSYFISQPSGIPASMLPALVVSETDTNYELGPTGMDSLVHQVTVNVIYDKRIDFGKPPEGAGVDVVVNNLIQGRNTTTGDYHDYSVVGVLRRNFTIASYTIRNILGAQFAPNRRSEDLYTYEGFLNIEVEELQVVANRA